MVQKFSTTTKDIGLLHQLYKDDQLSLSPEFQRNAVWPRPARAYLIDTILSGQPIPVIFLQRSVSPQTNRIAYSVVDGQQRLNSIFLFMENRFSLTQSSEDDPWYRCKWRDLPEEYKERFLSYDFTIQELSGYSELEIRDIFRRMNRYVVALNQQEYRHSDTAGAFKEVVESVGTLEFWENHNILTSSAIQRMRNDELSAELLILLNEGPQDKKTSVDFYYESYKEGFPEGAGLAARLSDIFAYIESALPNFKETHLRKPATLYSLVGAIQNIHEEGQEMPKAGTTGSRLLAFDEEISETNTDRMTSRAAAFSFASQSQTDNLRPRLDRIDILKRVILGE